MKINLTVLVVIVVASVIPLVSGCNQMGGNQKNVQETVAKAQASLNSKNFGQAVEIARTAVVAEPKNAKALFVMAEAQSANGDCFGALKSLDDAFRNGYDNKDSIYTSEYLEKTRASAGFNELMTKYGLAKAKTAKKASKGTTYQSEDSISAGDVKINMKEIFKDDK